MITCSLFGGFQCFIGAGCLLFRVKISSRRRDCLFPLHLFLSVGKNYVALRGNFVLNVFLPVAFFFSYDFFFL